VPSRAERGLQVRWHLAGTRPVRSLVTGRAVDGVPELVVVPGLGALGYLLPLVRACAGWTRVTLLDLPGFGHPTTARLPADLASVADTLCAWLDDVVDVPVVLLGHSTGAQSALRAARAAPQAVAQLVLAGATFPPRSRSWGALVRATARTVVHERPGELPAVLPYYLRGRHGLLDLLRTALVDRPEDAVAAVEPPVLVLRGQQDRLSPQDWAADLAARAPRGRLAVLPGAHNFVWTAPDAASRVLLDSAPRHDARGRRRA
jgi:pimeloyl-ACP methyl ester carboxylesterase